MQTPLLLGIDVGTSSAKAVLMDAQGAVIAVAARSHTTFSPGPGLQEQDGLDWWRGTCHSVREILSQTDIHPGDIAGVSLSGQGCACLPVDSNGDPLARASIWTDTRADEQQKYIREALGTDLGRVAGNDIYDQPEPRMMWLRDNAPALYSRTACFMSTVSYLIYRLTGEFRANTSDWGFHLAFDRKDKTWHEDFLKIVGLTSDKFPQLFAPHQVVGQVTRPASGECGLQAGTPVIAGGQDSTVSALAVGSLEAGQSVYMRGTTDLLSICTDSHRYHPDLYTTCAVLPGLYMSYDMKEVVAAGAAHKWLAMMLFSEAPETIFEEMNQRAAASPPGCNGVVLLPYMLMSTTADPDQRRDGLFFGIDVNTRREDLIRAVMEGTAYALRESLERIGQAGITISDLRATGGPTRSHLWNQITADVTGLPVFLPAVSAGAAYGAAILAGLGVGVFPMDEGYQRLRQIIELRARFYPAPTISPDYERTYLAFLQLARATRGIGPRLKGSAK